MNHRLFYENLNALGVDAKVYNWISQSPKGRSFRVGVQGYPSDRTVANRSILRVGLLSLMFLMYVKDITDGLVNPYLV